MALVGAAGPVSNLLLAVIFTVLLKLSVTFVPSIVYLNESNLKIYMILVTFLSMGVHYNVAFAVFNMLPIPPFDGSRVLYVFLPPKYYFGVMKYERYIAIGLLVLLILGVLDPVFSFLTNNIVSFIYFIVGL